MATRRRISREEILEGAAAILDSGVFGDLTVDSLARQLHMSKSTLYKHFASKEDLIVALVDALCRHAERDLEEAHLTGDAAKALETVARVYGDHAARLPRAVILQLSRLPSPCQDRIELTAATVAPPARSSPAAPPMACSSTARPSSPPPASSPRPVPRWRLPPAASWR